MSVFGFMPSIAASGAVALSLYPFWRAERRCSLFLRIRILDCMKHNMLKYTLEVDQKRHIAAIVGPCMVVLYRNASLPDPLLL